MGKKEYRYLNGTPVNVFDDIYTVGDDYTNINLMYRYEKIWNLNLLKMKKIYIILKWHL